MSNSPRPKSLAMMFLLGAFLTGGAVGFVADRAMAKPTLATTDLTPREALARELGLTPEQRVVIDSAWDWRRARQREIMSTVQPSLDAVRDSARVLMMNTLDDKQKDAFRALIERNQRVADSTAKAKGETK